MSPLEREYSPSSMVDDIAPFIESYERLSLAARDELAHHTVSYGSGEDELIDVFPAGDGGPVHVFVHGGYWQELSRRYASLPAPGFVRRGVTFCAPGYTLAPKATLSEIVDQVRRAIAHVACEVKSDGASLVVSGSSAGAHLAAMAAASDWAELGFGRSPIDGLVLVSGVFDLRPLVDTYVNDALGLDSEESWRLSPARVVGEVARVASVVVAVGEVETNAFRRQSERFAASLRDVGADVTFVDVGGRNHFDIVEDLSDPMTTLGAAVVSLEHHLRTVGR